MESPACHSRTRGRSRRSTSTDRARTRAPTWAPRMTLPSWPDAAPTKGKTINRRGHDSAFLQLILFLPPHAVLKAARRREASEEDALAARGGPAGRTEHRSAPE